MKDGVDFMFTSLVAVLLILSLCVGIAVIRDLQRRVGQLEQNCNQIGE